MSEPTNPAPPTAGTDPTPQELAEILADLEFFQNLDDADALPLEELAEADDER